MANYYVRYQDMSTQAEAIGKAGGKLASFESRINSIANAIDTRDSTMAVLKTQLKNQARKVPDLSSRAASAGTVLTEITRQYKETEKRNFDSLTGVESKVEAETGGQASSGNEAPDGKRKTTIPGEFWDVIGKLGVAGSIITLVGKPISGWILDGFAGSIDPSYYITVLKDGTSALEKVLKIGSGAKTAADLTASWSSWTTIGAGLTLAGKGADYYKEYKEGNMSGGQAFTNALLEGGIEVAKNFGIKALVGKGAVMLLGGLTAPVSAPVVMGVAVTGLALSWGLDKISEAVTGEKFSKVAKDAVLSAYDYASDKVNKVVTGIGNGLKSLVNCFKTPSGSAKAAWAR